ncbi:MAG: hypothetical protein COA86_06935 [Kangiella sp.]|nr:MAG: hypothetical protein COA86_06935 [Kangiella sp.]
MDRYATIFSIASGKGGVGKTQICANLAVSLAEMGKKVCIVDADYGLANINIVLGISANQSQNSYSVEEIHQQIYQYSNPLPFVIKTDLGIDLLPSISGLSVKSHSHKAPNESQISQMLNSMKAHYDVILIDTAAGIDIDVKNYISVADHTLVIINTEPTSLTDSFGLIRTMKNVSNSFEIIINRVSSAETATKTYRRFASAVKKYIGIEISALGYIREDTLVSAALLSQRVLIKYSPDCMASRCIKRLAARLMEIIKATPKHQNEIVIEKPNASVSTETPDLNDISVMENPKVVFDSWLDQIGQLINSEHLNSDEKNNRVQKFISELEIICEKDHEFLTALESLVVSIGIDEENKSNPNLSRFNISGNSILS